MIKYGIEEREEWESLRIKRAELLELIKQEKRVVKELEGQNRYSHKQCLVLKKTIDNAVKTHKALCDKHLNIKRKTEQAEIQYRNYAQRIGKFL